MNQVEKEKLLRELGLVEIREFAEQFIDQLRADELNVIGLKGVLQSIEDGIAVRESELGLAVEGSNAEQRKASLTALRIADGDWQDLNKTLAEERMHLGQLQTEEAWTRRRLRLEELWLENRTAVVNIMAGGEPEERNRR